LSPTGGLEQTAPEKSSNPDVPVNVFAIPTADGTEVSWKSPAKSPNAPDATAFTLVSCGPFQIGTADLKNATAVLCDSQQSRDLVTIPARQRVDPDPSSNLPVDPLYVLRPDGTFETVVKCKPTATQFCVIAVGSVADSGKSGPVVVGSGGIGPDAPSGLTLKATATGSGLDLLWKAPADVAQANEMPALAQSFEVWRDDLLVARGIKEPHYLDETCGVARRCNERVFAITAAGRSEVLEGAAVTSGTKAPTITAATELLAPGASVISGSLGHGSEDQRPVAVTVTPIGDLAGRVAASTSTLSTAVAEGAWSSIIPASVSPGRYSLIAQQGLMKSAPIEVGIAPIVPLRASISGASGSGVPQLAFGSVVVAGDATPSPPASAVVVRELWGSPPPTVGARTQAELASWFDAALGKGKVPAVVAEVSADGHWVTRASTSNGLGQRHVLEVSQIVPGVGLSRVFVEFDLLARPSIIPISPTPSILIRASAFSPQATAPVAPTALQATPADSSASISFIAGANGGAAITNYQYQVGTGAWTALSPADAVSPVTIPGLVNGTAYSIKLRAVNSAGFGATSAAVTVTPRKVPDAPTRLVATPADRSATISFTAGANGGSAITNYQYQVGTGAWTALSPAVATSPVTIPSLVNGTTYSIKLRAVNAAGFGAESAPVSVVPLAPSAAPTSLVATPGNGTV